MPPRSAPQREVETRKNSPEERAAEVPDPFLQKRTVDCGDERHLGNRVLGEPGGATGQAHVSEHVRPAEIRGKRHDDDSREAAPVQGVALNDYDRTAKARCRAPGWRQVRPENVALRDCYHSTSRRTR